MSCTDHSIRCVQQVILAAGVMLSYFTNYGVAQRYKSGAEIWRIPFGLQLVPSGLMGIGLLFATESPRWLAKVGRTEEALRNLAFLRRKQLDDEAVVLEMAEINAAIREESAEKVSIRYCLFTKGVNIRFFITFAIFVLQQWSGQVSCLFLCCRFWSYLTDHCVSTLPCNRTRSATMPPKSSSRSDTMAPRPHFSPRASTVWSSSLLHSSGSCSVLKRSDDVGRSSPQRWAWASSSSSLVAYSKPTLQASLPQARLLPRVPWPVLST